MLLNQPEFLEAIAAATLASLTAEADDGARQRFNRRWSKSPDAVRELASRLAVQVAAAYPPETKDVPPADELAEGTESAIAAELTADAGLSDWQVLQAAMQDPATLPVLEGAIVGAAHLVFASDQATAEQLEFVRKATINPIALREMAENCRALVITLPALRPYGGRLADIPDAELLPAIVKLLTNWLKKGVTP